MKVFFRSAATTLQPALWLMVALIACSLAKAQTTPSPSLPLGVLIDTDWGQPNLVMQEQKSERVTGTLPAPWHDDSSWAKVWVNYQPGAEDGQKFVRVNVTNLQDGRAQVAHPLPDVTGDKIYQLQLTVRGTTELPLTIGVRQQGAPYKFLWDTPALLTNSWQNLSYQFQLPKNDQPIGLWLMTDTKGHFDIARVKLVETTQAELIKSLEARYPFGGPRNLLRTTSFPLGLQSGWWLQTETDVAPDAKTVGPSGAASLHIQAAQPFQLFSAPFTIPLATKQHVASFYLRGRGTGRCIVWGEGKELATKKFDLQDGTHWQRQEIAFTPDLLTHTYALRFEGTGEFWLDALQVEAGATAKSYTPQLQCEVALSSNSPVNVQFENEPAVVRYCVSGAPAGAALRSKIVNLYGEVAQQPTTKLRPQPLNWGQLPYALFQQHPLGAFRIESWVEDGKGQRISPYNEIVINRLHRPRYWMKDAPHSPFGSHMVSTTQNILLAKSIGINWTRLHDAGMEYIGWKYLEPEKGKWSFRDAEINRFRQNGMKILGELTTAPYWASYFQKPHESYYDQFYQPKNMDDYASYVRVVTARYKGVIDTYEVWNEPWNHEWWGISFDETNTSESHGYRTSANPQADFARLMKTAYDNAKAVNPALIIAGFNTSTSDPGTGHHSGHDWTQGVLESGGLNSCDVITYHQYMSSDAGFPNDEVEKGFANATGPILAKVGRLPKPVWLSEGSPLYGMNKSSGFYNYTLTTPNTDPLTRSGDRLCRFEVALLGQGVQKTFLYSMSAHGFFGEKNEWGVLVNPDGTLHPSGVALSHLTWLLEDTSFVRRIPLADGVYAYLFQGAGRSIAAISTQGTHSYKLPISKNLTLTDLWGTSIAAGSDLGSTLVYASLPGAVDALEKALTQSKSKR